MQQFPLHFSPFCVLCHLGPNLVLTFNILSNNLHQIIKVFKRSENVFSKALTMVKIKVTWLIYHFSISYISHYRSADNFSPKSLFFLLPPQTVTSAVCWMCMLLVLAPTQHNCLTDLVGLDLWHLSEAQIHPAIDWVVWRFSYMNQQRTGLLFFFLFICLCVFMYKRSLTKLPQLSNISSVTL